MFLIGEFEFFIEEGNLWLVVFVLLFIDGFVRRFSAYIGVIVDVTVDIDVLIVGEKGMSLLFCIWEDIVIM